jgi:mono/diheme cytochrome c family protein
LTSYRKAVCAGCIALLVTLAVSARDAPSRFDSGRSSYLEGCGGCHGILGSAPHSNIPELRDMVGIFMCTQAGREYVVRLPNVAFAAVDDAGLADLMNYVVFRLGGVSLPDGVKPYTAAEVAALRRRPLKNQPLLKMREEILIQAARNCERLNDKLVIRQRGLQ